MECIGELVLEDTCSTGSDDDDSYIEIALDHMEPTSCYIDDEEEEDKNKSNLNNCEEEEYELRISISSTLADVQEISSSVLNLKNCSTNTNSKTVTVTGAAAAAEAESKVIKPLQQQHSIPFSFSRVTQTGEGGPAGVQFPAQNQYRPFNTASASSLMNSRVLSAQTSMQMQQRAAPVMPYKNADLLYTRKQPSMTTTTTNGGGGMMSLLIKFRGIKLGALFASLVKPRQSNNGLKKSSKKSNQKKLGDPSNGRRSKQHWGGLGDDSIGESDSFTSSKKFLKMLEMDLGAVRGMLMSIAQKASRSKRSTSSSSCDTSPIHEGFSFCSSSSSDNSIQAAIAYCKSSFQQQTSNFSF